MSSASGSLGWTWKGHLAYYDYQTKTEKQFKKVPKLKGELDKEEIVRVYKCFHPMAITLDKAFHEYVIFRAKKNGTVFFHSIEKNSEEIVWQRSKDSKDVLYRLKNVARPSGKVSEKSDVEGDIHDLIDWLENESQITRKYNVLYDNCQHFAASVYGAVNQFKAEGMPEDIMAHPELSASDSDADMIDAFQILNDEITRSYHEYERRQKRGLAPVDH
ncbi:uncharacterized protein LOC128209582 isoform X1 [Mya arenaria]|uniref:uncharacterized protein LOC128209582 isoform X1 n=1 Tax=Mya arenaria TaxID=6604 RepID=UPI0022DEA611|nr:uncharacterized protein LOC128209582 isoform X1 [Mya arenaria]